jgi:hypothetical protein
MQFPAFSYTYSTWPGASYALGELAANPGFDYAFRLNIAAQSTTFVPVIRTGSGGNFTRYKLWTTGAEIVPFGLYGGEKISAAENPTLEIWCVNGELTAEMAAPWLLDISKLEDPASLNDTEGSIIAV